MEIIFGAEIIIALFIVGGLIWFFLRDTTPTVDPISFQRMANEYSQDGYFMDETGLSQSDPDILIDMWLTINGTGARYEEAAVGINEQVERHHSGVRNHP